MLSNVLRYVCLSHLMADSKDIFCGEVDVILEYGLGVLGVVDVVLEDGLGVVGVVVGCALVCWIRASG